MKSLIPYIFGATPKTCSTPFRTTSFFDDFFSDFFDVRTRSYYGSQVEKIDDQTQKLNLEMPGFSKDELSVTFKEDERLLTIEAESKKEGSDRKYSRSMYVPDNWKVESAELEHGLLEVILKDDKPPEKEPLRIPIK